MVELVVQHSGHLSAHYVGYGRKPGRESPVVRRRGQGDLLPCGRCAPHLYRRGHRGYQAGFSRGGLPDWGRRDEAGRGPTDFGRPDQGHRIVEGPPGWDDPSIGSECYASRIASSDPRTTGGRATPASLDSPQTRSDGRRSCQQQGLSEAGGGQCLEVEESEPDWTWSWQTYLEKERLVVAGVEERVCECTPEHRGVAGLDQEVEKISATGRRYKAKYCSCGWCPVMEKIPGALARGVHVLMGMLGRAARGPMYRELQRVRSLIPHLCPCRVRRYFKERTGLLKMGGQFITRDWDRLVYWEVFFGYRQYRGAEACEKEVKSWLVDPVVIDGVPGGSKRFCDAIGQRVEQYLLRSVDPGASGLRNYKPLDAWVAEGIWMRGRTGDGDKATVSISGKTVKTRRYKGVDSLTMSDEEIKKSILRPSKEWLHAMEKSEPAKVRAVVKTGNAMNRRMDFVSSWLEAAMGAAPNTCLMGGARTAEKMDLDLLGAVRDNGWLKVPLDQGGFDRHQPKGAVLAVISAIARVIRKVGAPDEVKKVMGTIEEVFRSGDVWVECGRQVWRWGNGVPSGWRWTGLIDTLLSLAEFDMVKDMVQKLTRQPVETAAVYGYGDDITFCVRSKRWVDLFLAVYRRLGFEVHAQKTFVSRCRTEFLRRNYTREGIFGYLPRSVLALQYTNPIQSIPIKAETRLHSRLTLWLLGVGRGADDSAVARGWLADMREVGVDTEKAAAFALTPASVGGGGVVRGRPAAGVFEEAAGMYRGKWVLPRCRTTRKEVSFGLGRWADRVRRWTGGIVPRGFEHTLAEAWGVQESELYDEIQVEWEVMVPFSGVPPKGPPAPRPEEVWDIDGMPRLLRAHAQRWYLRDENEEWLKKMVKPAMWDWVQWLRRRVSKRVFSLFMLGELHIPWPEIEKIGSRYGVEVKRWANEQLLRLFTVKDQSLRGVEKGMLWIETQIAKKMKAMGVFGVLGQ
ncbi:MAG: RNA-dependent RNA polymerase [Fushun totivirus 3]|nr:MAG: RNA-dependent RNA polymerase [Fushun totivirus 3]